MTDQDHIFLDTETGSLDPETGCIIELAGIRTDCRGRVIASYCDRIIPDREVSKEAAAVNGYNEKEWKKNGVSFDAAIRSFVRNLVTEYNERVIFVGHFCDFDRAFIKSDCLRHGVEIPLQTRAWICTGSLIWPFLFNGQLKSRRLIDVCKFLELPYGQDGSKLHNAALDTKACCDVYWEIMRRYSTALLAHSAVSKSGAGQLLKFGERLINGF